MSVEFLVKPRDATQCMHANNLDVIDRRRKK